MLNHVGEQQDGNSQCERQPEFLTKAFNCMACVFVVAGMGIVMRNMTTLRRVVLVGSMMVVMMCVMFHTDVFKNQTAFCRQRLEKAGIRK
jgi:uncharacterized membrane protein YcjF (UPF0283 family)